MPVFSLLLAALSFISPYLPENSDKTSVRGAFLSRANLLLHLLTRRRGFPSRTRAGEPVARLLLSQKAF